MTFKISPFKENSHALDRWTLKTEKVRHHCMVGHKCYSLENVGRRGKVWDLKSDSNLISITF